jgi:hypothetical protein
MDAAAKIKPKHTTAPVQLPQPCTAGDSQDIQVHAAGHPTIQNSETRD